MNYFRMLCFFWAFIGLLSRFMMIYLGEKWMNLELTKVYSPRKPKWIYFIGFVSLFIFGFTWYQVFVTQIRYSVILAILVTITLIKIYSLIYEYEKFRSFAIRLLLNKRLLFLLNFCVIMFSLFLILLGLFVYR